jgi:hypothetical protein
MNNNPKIIVTNIIVIVLAVLSIITLCTGNFFAVQLSIHVDGDLLTSVAEEQMQEGEENDVDYATLFEGIDMNIPFSFQLQSAVLLQAVTGDSSAAVRAMLDNQLGIVIDDLFNLVDEVLAAFTKIVINTVVEKAKDQIYHELAASLGGNPTDEQVMQELESQYGISESDIDNLATDLSDTLIAFLQGGPNAVSETLQTSETLDKLVSVYAEQALIDSQGAGSYTQAEIDAKAQELKNDIIHQFDEAIAEWSPEGDISEDGIIVWLFNKIQGEEGTHIANTDEVKAYIADKIFGGMDESTIRYISSVLKYLGIFLLIVIGSWAYLILKILVKFFARNKTVGMFFPKFFGWMPYVLFVGIPSILFRSLNTILNKFAAQLSMDAGTVATFSEFANWITVKFSALTWVSALCSVALMIIWFFYHRWRKEAKAAKRAGK